ncbi:unnamed protein product, partial [Porites evermanni]
MTGIPVKVKDQLIVKFTRREKRDEIYSKRKNLKSKRTKDLPSVVCEPGSAVDTPPGLYDLAHPASAVHNYNTRYATNQNLCRSFSKTNYGLA